MLQVGRKSISVFLEAFFSLSGKVMWPHAVPCIWGALSHLSIVASMEMAIVSLTWSFQIWVLSAHIWASLTG